MQSSCLVKCPPAVLKSKGNNSVSESQSSVKNHCICNILERAVQFMYDSVYTCLEHIVARYQNVYQKGKGG
jgi:hypothetical protein